MKLLSMLECLKIKSEEENLLKNQIMCENTKQSIKISKKPLKQIIIAGIQTIMDPKTHKLLTSVDAKTKSQSWFSPSLKRKDVEEYLKEEPDKISLD